MLDDEELDAVVPPPAVPQKAGHPYLESWSIACLVLDQCIPKRYFFEVRRISFRILLAG